ncbi:unnamed protein product [Closterium sp. NIES-54]
MDFVTGLPSNPGGNDAVMAVVDRLMKMAHFSACKKSISAEEIARLFIAGVVRLHGIPAAIISDRDTKFTSNFWKNLWEQFGTRLQFSSSYHPETDGQTERTNQTMELLIRATCDDPTTWEQQLPLIEFACNNAMSATTQQSPFYPNNEQNPTVPMTPSPDNPTPRAQQFAEILQAARTRAAEAIKKANVIAKRNADRHRRPVTYQSGDYVLLDPHNFRLPVVPKLRPRYCGPFQISHMTTPVTAHLLLPTDWYISPSFHRAGGARQALTVEMSPEAGRLAAAIENMAAVKLHDSLQLPDELLQQVFAYLGPRELLRVGGVGTLWHRVSCADPIWESICVKRWSVWDRYPAITSALPAEQSFRTAAAGSSRSLLVREDRLERFRQTAVSVPPPAVRGAAEFASRQPGREGPWSGTVRSDTSARETPLRRDVPAGSAEEESGESPLRAGTHEPHATLLRPAQASADREASGATATVTASAEAAAPFSGAAARREEAWHEGTGRLIRDERLGRVAGASAVESATGSGRAGDMREVYEAWIREGGGDDETSDGRSGWQEFSRRARHWGWRAVFRFRVVIEEEVRGVLADMAWPLRRPQAIRRVLQLGNLVVEVRYGTVWYDSARCGDGSGKRLAGAKCTYWDG